VRRSRQLSFRIRLPVPRGCRRGCSCCALSHFSQRRREMGHPCIGAGRAHFTCGLLDSGSLNDFLGEGSVLHLGEGKPYSGEFGESRGLERLAPCGWLFLSCSIPLLAKGARNGAPGGSLVPFACYSGGHFLCVYFSGGIDDGFAARLSNHGCCGFFSGRVVRHSEQRAGLFEH
jgi:hypothetical protein